MGKTIVYFDVKLGNQVEKRVTVEMFEDTPVSGLLFNVTKIEHGHFLFCEPEKSQHFPVPKSSLIRKHACAGIVSVSKNLLSITLGKAGFLDTGKFSIIGQVVGGMDVLKELETVPLDARSGKPRVAITLSTSVRSHETEVEYHPVVERPVETASSQRLFELRLRMNKAKQLNNQAVLMEKKRLSDPKKYMQSLSSGAQPPSQEENVADPLLHQTVEAANRNATKGTAGETFAWDMFNEDSLYKAHDKRIDQMGFYPDAYDKQKESMGQTGFYANPSNVGHKPSEDAKERLAESIRLAGQKRKEFSRRRMQNDDDDDVLWINEKNKQFTKRIERAFGEHTAEIKANLERGTAL